MTDQPRERVRPGPTTAWSVREVLDGRVRPRPDRVITEEPLEIRLAWPGEPSIRVAVTMRTPGHDFELASGFLASEGLLAPGETPHGVSYCKDVALTADQQYNVVTVERDSAPRHLPSARYSAVSSACGVCGVESLDDVFPPDQEPIPVAATLPADLLPALPDLLRGHQPLFDKTGSVHAAAILGFDGSIVVVREDIGRHNAVDKVIGARVLQTVRYGTDAVLCTSGRIGFDILAKAAVARIAVVVGVGGASSLAVGLAERAGLTVCGFARRSRCVVYTHPERVAEAACEPESVAPPS